MCFQRCQVELLHAAAAKQPWKLQVELEWKLTWKLQAELELKHVWGHVTGAQVLVLSAVLQELEEKLQQQEKLSLY